MLQELLFYETVHTAALSLRAVEEIRATDDIHRLELQVVDILPDREQEPWQLRIEQQSRFRHSLFGTEYPCIELSLPLWIIQPQMPGYLELVAASAAPCLDHQRFTHTASVTWDPDSGQMAVYSQLRQWEQAQTTLIARLTEHVRDVVALAYLTSFRMWQLRFRQQVPEAVSDPVVEKVHRQMMDLIGADPPSA